MTSISHGAHVRHEVVHRTGVVLLVLGLVLVVVALIAPRANASTNYEFKGQCVGTGTSGTCVLDEPEGRNPAVHGLVTYTRVGDTIVFDIQADAKKVKYEQICMQTTGPFAVGAKVCAGSHGPHVAFTRVGTIYTVDLKAAGLATANPLYWTIHLKAGDRTLQVIGQCSLPPTTTTTSTPPVTTTSTTAHTTTSTTAHTTSTTTHASTTSSTPSSTTSTSVPASTTSTSVPPTTSTSATGATTTTAAPSVTTTTAPGTTPTTLGVQVAGKNLARTGGVRWWTLLLGAALALVGSTLIVSVRLVRPRHA